jgi:putative transposase
MGILLQRHRTKDGRAEANLTGGEAVGHITYVWTHEGWLYLAVILDLYSRRIVALRQAQEGGQRQDDPKGGVANKDLAIRALDMAVRLRNPPPGCLFNLDRGSSQIYADCVNLPAILFLRLSKEAAGRLGIIGTRVHP